MDSLPEDILWDGLGEEAPPIFVVYTLVHFGLEESENQPFRRLELVEIADNRSAKRSVNHFAVNRKPLASPTDAQGPARCRYHVTPPLLRRDPRRCGMPRIARSMVGLFSL